MTTPLLKLALAPIVARRRRVRLLWCLAACWGVAAVIALAMAGAGVHPLPTLLLALITGIAGVVVWKRCARWEPDYRDIAQLVEQRHPELHALLVTAVEQRPDPKSGQLHFLQQRVVQQALDESRRHSWIDAVPASRHAAAVFAQFAMLAALAFSLVHLDRAARRHSRDEALARNAVQITPGNVSIERGSGLVVLAKFGQPIPSEAVLVIQPRNEAEQRLSLVKNLDDPVFGGGLPEVDADLAYRIEYSGKSTQEFHVSVFEHPRLERADATLAFPEYTHLPEKKIPDTRRISAVEGTKLGVEFQLNKPVKSAKLVGKNKSVIPLAVDPQKAVATLKDFTLKAGETYEIALEDADGRANKLPAQLIVDVRPNRRPELKFTAPKGDQHVTALQEVAFKTEAWDDFGMPAYGVSYTVAGQPPQEVVLGRDSKPDERVIAEHLLKLEESGVRQDQLVSWHLWADDIGPDGKLRRTTSDLFFAEVRPFEEIFRAGQGGEGGQQQSPMGNAAEKMAAAQKQIVVATWNLKRSEEAKGAPSASEQYQKDEPVIREAQEDGLKKATAMIEESDDAKTKAFLETATGAMKTAVERLTDAVQSPAPLPAALDAEQAAYDALLKLAAHEFQVSRSRSQQGGQQGGQSRQAELDQLEMKDEKDRYEAKSEARPAQNEQQREQLALFNRLKELAQRQNDVNARMKELQTALQEAKTEKEKEDLKRQLKRLREEEQQLLADLDEAKQKMDQSQSAHQFADERKQLEETRAETQKSAEAMEKNEPSDALASGTRAERQLQKVRDDFRKKTAGEFKDDLREMRTSARELAQKQEELGAQLGEPDAQSHRTLDGSSPREKLEKQFGEQGKALGDLREKMKDVSEKAEGPEPLLAKELYDSLRRNTQAGTDQTLDRAGQLASRGYAGEAKKFEAKARQEIEELKSGVERAAESVLGSEAEALRTARAELDSLARELNKEIAKADPSLAETPGEHRAPGAGKPDENSKNGEQSDNKSPDGKQTGTAAPDRTQPGANPGDGQQPGENREAREGKEPGKNPGEGRSKGQGQQPGLQAGTQPGENQPGEGQRSGQGEKGGDQPGKPQGGQPGDGQQPSGEKQRGPGGGNGGAAQDGKDSPSPTPSDHPGSQLHDIAKSPRQRGGVPTGGGDGGGDRGGGIESPEGPLRGDNFVEWSDRLRNVEEMVDEPAIRNEVARVRELAQGMRQEFKRHSVEPKWDLVKTKISAPLAELRDRLSEELARRESKESLVPIDRDPVPPKYSEHVRRYYEELGRSR